MFAMTRTFCIVIVVCSVALLTLNSSIPAPVDNNPIWSGNGATHVLHTDIKHGNHTMRARAAAFGGSIEEALELKVLLHAPDGDDLGCHLQPINPSLRGTGDVIKSTRAKAAAWILVMRGECAFVDKVRRAQAAGYAGVIVGDDGNAYDSLITMFARGAEDVSIPALFVTHASYALMQVAANGQEKLKLTVVTSEMRTDWPLLDTLIFICFSPLCTLFIVYIVLYFRRRRLHLNNILPPAYLSKLETVEYMAKDGVNAECVICLENFVEAETVLELPCKHLYHQDCIRKWLIERKKLCPICKRDVSVGIDVRQGRISEAQVESLEAEATEETPLLQLSTLSEEPAATTTTTTQTEHV